MALSSVELSPRMGSQVLVGKADLVSGTHAAEIRALLDQRGVLLFRGLAPDDGELRAIARTLGDVALSRAVGAAMGANPIPLIIPCHRVLASGGGLGGYTGGLERKQLLLDLERSDALF